jgi:hypothetical protein
MDWSLVVALNDIVVVTGYSPTQPDIWMLRSMVVMYYISALRSFRSGQPDFSAPLIPVDSD